MVQCWHYSVSVLSWVHIYKHSTHKGHHHQLATHKVLHEVSSMQPLNQWKFPASFLHACMQVKRFLEQANNHLPNLSRNLFILFNHWDQVVDEDDDSDSDDDCDDAIKRQESKALQEQHLRGVHEFFVQGLQSNGVLDRTFFVSGKEVCKAQENEKKGKQPSAGRSVVYIYIQHSQTPALRLLFIN